MANDRNPFVFDMVDAYGMRLNDDIADTIYRRFGAEVAQMVMDALMRSQSSRPTGNAEALAAQVKQFAEVFAKLKKAANPYATVTGVRNDRATITFAGKTLEVEKPADATLKAGMTVRITPDTMQIIDVVPEPPTAGEVATVTRVASDSMCEIDRAGVARAISYSGTIEDGDRVVLDASGSVAVANIGKAPSDGIISEPTGVTWDDIGGLEEAKRAMREAVESPTKHKSLLARYGKKPIRGVLLYGPPGCGKTMLGKAAATAMAELHGDAAAGAFFYVKGPSMLNMYVGNSEENVRKLFAQARRHRRKTGHAAIIFIDEADAILGRRGDGRGLSSTMVPAFLAEMDGLEDSGALVLLATNRPDSLDPAVVRDGRIDRRIKVGRPDQDATQSILERALRGRPIDGCRPKAAAKFVLSALYDKSLVLYRVKKHTSVGDGVALTLGHVVNGAMLAGIVDRATSVAMHREIAGGGASGITLDDLRAGVDQTYAQAKDVDHREEILEFIEGWEREVVAVTKASGRAVSVSSGAN